MNPNCTCISLIKKLSHGLCLLYQHMSQNFPGQSNLETSQVSQTWRLPGSAELGDLQGQPNLETSRVSRIWSPPRSAEPGDFPGQPNLETSRGSRTWRPPGSAEFGDLPGQLNLDTLIKIFVILRMLL